MSVTRRRRGSLKDGAPLGWMIERTHKARFDELALRAGLSQAVFLERVIEHLEVDADQQISWSAVPNNVEAPTDSP